MKLSKKNFFSAMRDAWKRSTVAMLCMVVIGLLVAFSCEKLRNGSKNLQHVRTELGGCNGSSDSRSDLDYGMNRGDSGIEGDTVIITVSNDSVHVFVGLTYTCKLYPFETKVEIIDDVVYMHIIDTCDGGDCYKRCHCYYTFDFAFKRELTRTVKFNQKYKIFAYLNIRPDWEEMPRIISEGIISNPKNR